MVINSQQQPYPYPPKKKQTRLLFIHQTHTPCPGGPRCLLSNDAAHKGLVNLKDLRKVIDRRDWENLPTRNFCRPEEVSPVKMVCLVFCAFFFFRWGGGVWKGRAWLSFFDVFFWGGMGCLFCLFVFFSTGVRKRGGRWCKGFCVDIVIFQSFLDNLSWSSSSIEEFQKKNHSVWETMN